MKFFKKHKVGCIVMGVIAALIIALVLYLKSAVARAQEMLAQMQEQTAVVEVRDLSSVVPTIGTITSVSQDTVIAEVANVKVDSVLVNVGDEVKEGDLICVLNTEELEKELEDANKTLKNTKTTSNISVNSASRALSETQTDAALSKERNDKKLSDAKKKVEDYQNLKEQASSQYDNAMAEAAKYGEAVKAAQAKVTSLTAALSNPDISGGDLIDVQTQLTAARAELDNASAAYSQAQSAASQHLANYNSLVTTINELEGSYESIKESNADSERLANSKIATEKDSVTSASISKDNSMRTAQNSVEALEQKIEACQVYATKSGIVTSLGVKEGDTYAGAAIATIEDVSSYEIKTTIDEYDIGKIEVGQKAVIKTNGTGDEILNGHVKFISPRGASNGSLISYEVIVAIDTANKNLRLDMTAKVSIILSEKKSVITVPYEAVRYDDNDGAYVEVVRADGTKENVNVIVGIENDYYVEIVSGDIKEGDEVTVPRDLSDILDLNSMLVEVDDGGGF